MITWEDSSTWPFVPPGYHPVPDIFDALGRKIFTADWTGRENRLLKPKELPKPAEIYTSHDSERYDPQFRPLDPTLALHNTDRRPLNCSISDYQAYNKHLGRAAELVGVNPITNHALTFEQWCEAYDKSIVELRDWKTNQERRETVFKWMHRRAAAGDLVFEFRDQPSGAMILIERERWNCEYPVARARFLRCAINRAFLMTPPPLTPRYLELYNAGFTDMIVVQHKLVVAVLKNTSFEKDPSSAGADGAVTPHVAQLLAASERNIDLSAKPSIPADRSEQMSSAGGGGSHNTTIDASSIAAWAQGAVERSVPVREAWKDASTRMPGSGVTTSQATEALKAAMQAVGQPVRRGRPVGSKSFAKR